VVLINVEKTPNISNTEINVITNRQYSCYSNNIYFSCSKN